VKFIDWPSPNFNDRVDGEKPSMLVIHFTGMRSTADVLERLCDTKHVPPVSSHYLIDEAGNIYTLVDEEKRAWHAGVSYWHGNRDVNSSSIGIEISNRKHEAYTPEQLVSLTMLCQDIMARHNIKPENVVGHSDVAPDRKQDPGYHFPWQKMAQNDVGIWPKPTLRDKFNAAAVAKKPEKLKKLFADAGYQVEAFGENKPSLEQLINAFQQRYEQDAFNNPKKTPGVATKDTVAQLRAVARINKKLRPKNP
jgi:N-acetylmuramoyl-L-alanine amidase